MPCPKPTWCVGQAPVDVEHVGPVPHPLVAVGRAEQQQHLVALGHLLAVQLDVARERARHHLRRALVAQDLLDRVGDAAGIGQHLGPLGRETLQREQAVAEQLRRRLVARR